MLKKSLIAALSLMTLFWYTTNIDVSEQAIAQPIQNPFPNDTETAQRFADLIEGNDTAIILNDTSISSLSNNLLDSIGVNIRDDCMRIPNSTVLYCP
jgi:hypothetical protein